LSVGALVAFMAPAVAQANVVLTNAAEEPVPTGTSVTATSANLQMVSTGATYKCEKVTLHFELTTNGTEHVVLAPTGASTTNCSASGLPATITDPTVLEDLTINTWGTGEATAEFTSDVVFAPLGIDLTNCHLEGKIHVQAAGGSSLNVGPSKLTNPGGSGAGCSEEGSMSGSFGIEDSNGNPLTLDFVATG
jgi:hypothetical protein